MKKLIAAFVTVFLLATSLFSLSVGAVETDINVNSGKYSPFWSEAWCPKGSIAEGMWKGFYIKKADNTLKTDIIQKSTGEWGVPGIQYAAIWEGLNIVAPGDEVDVGYLFTAVKGGKIEFTLVGKLDVPGATDIEISVFKNNFNTKLYPTSGNSVTAVAGKEVSINFASDLKKDDKVFFLFHSPVEVANSPQFRFSAFDACWRSLEGSTTIPTASSESQKPIGNTSSKDTTPTPGENTSSKVAATTDTPGNTDTTADNSSASTGGDIIIDDSGDQYPLTTKYEDVSIDEENDVITLTKKLTVKDFMDSFTIKNGHTIKLFHTDASAVTDDSEIVSSDMIVRVFNSGTPIKVCTIKTTYANDAAGDNGTSNGLPVWAIILICVGAVVVVAGAAVAVYFLVIKKKAVK